MIAFEVDDVALGSFVAGELPPVAKKITSFLDSLSLGKLVTTRKLAESVPGHIFYLRDKRLVYFQEYSYLYKGSVVWGSKETIAELKKLEEQ